MKALKFGYTHDNIETLFADDFTQSNKKLIWSYSPLMNTFIFCENAEQAVLVRNCLTTPGNNLVLVDNKNIRNLTPIEKLLQNIETVRSTIDSSSNNYVLLL